MGELEGCIKSREVESSAGRESDFGAGTRGNHVAGWQTGSISSQLRAFAECPQLCQPPNSNSSYRSRLAEKQETRASNDIDDIFASQLRAQLANGIIGP